MITTFRFIVRLTFAYVTRFKGTILIGIFLGILTFILAGIIAPQVAIKTERVGVTGRYHTDNLPPFILSMISNGLTKIDSSGNVIPLLSSSWETSDRGKTWTFHLTDNAYWQDELKVKSQDIIYEFSDVEVERPDDKTLTFKLQDPFSPFPSVVSRPTFRQGLLGNGEWMVENITLAGSYVQELELVKGKNEKKIFKFYPTSERTRFAYKLGQVDKIVKMFDPKPFDNWNTVKVEKETNRNQVITLFFNTQDPLLSDKTVRQALTYAVDKISLGERAISPISPNSWAFNPQVKKYEYDSKKAKDIIDDVFEDMDVTKELKLVSAPLLLPVAEKISNYWNDIGIKTHVQVTSIIPSEFQVFLSIYDIPRDPDQYSIWHSTQTSSNISKYSSPRIDKLLEDGRVNLNVEERKIIYIDFQRFILEDSPAAFLYHPAYYSISRK